MCEGGGGGRRRRRRRADDDLKTRTPHNDVGKKKGILGGRLHSAEMWSFGQYCVLHFPNALLKSLIRDIFSKKDYICFGIVCLTLSMSTV